MKHLRFMCLLVGLTGCTTVPAGQTASSALMEGAGVYTTTETFTSSDLRSPAWESDSFRGRHARQISDRTLSFKMEQSADEGGLDVGLEIPDFLSQTVSDIPRDNGFCSSYDLDLKGSGRWWAGPKISVNWQGDEAAKGNGDDWYENYIVEISSSTPGELHDIFTGDYFKGEVLPDTFVAGSVYKHYKIRFHTWWQFWSVRQEYRETGTVPVYEVMNVWIENGLPTNRRMDGIKANVETYGELSGEGRLRVDTAISSSDKPDCAF